MTLRRPVVRIGGAFKELPAGDTLPTLIPAAGAAGQVLTKNTGSDYDLVWAAPIAAKQIASSGDLAASPAAMVTFLGLGGYSDLFFDFNNVTNDYSSAQTHSAAFTVDGTTWTNSATITSSTASSNFLKGQVTLFGNSLGSPILQAIFAASNNQIAAPGLATTLSNLVRVAALVAGTPVTGIRFFPTSGGNYNRGNIVAWGR